VHIKSIQGNLGAQHQQQQTQTAELLECCSGIQHKAVHEDLLTIQWLKDEYLTCRALASSSSMALSS
jgi:hypothetical protein